MEEELPMLEITKRQKNIPWIEFGQVHVGSQFKKCLKVVNRRSEDVRLSLKLVGFQEGLSIEFEESSAVSQAFESRRTFGHETARSSISSSVEQRVV